MHAVNDRSVALGLSTQEKTKSSVESSKFKVIKGGGGISQSIEELSISISQSKKRRKSVHVKKSSIIKNREMLNRYFKNSVALNKSGKYRDQQKQRKYT